MLEIHINRKRDKSRFTMVKRLNREKNGPFHGAYPIIKLQRTTRIQLLTAGRRFDTAVPDDVMITAGL